MITTFLRMPSFRYLLVGVLCAVINLVIQTSSVYVFGLSYVVGNVISFSVLVPLSYYLHKKLTFRQSARFSVVEFVAYLAYWLGMLMLNLIVLVILVDYLNINVGAAIVLATCLLQVFGFLVSRKYVFSGASAKT